MKLLQEIIDPNTVNLTNMQQAVLVILQISPTPEVAFENTNGSEQSVYARNALRTLGIVQVGNNKAVVTETGKNVLRNYNLVDDGGQLTARGTEVLDTYQKQSKNQNIDSDMDQILPQS